MDRGWTRPLAVALLIAVLVNLSIPPASATTPRRTTSTLAAPQAHPRSDALAALTGPQRSGRRETSLTGADALLKRFGIASSAPTSHGLDQQVPARVDGADPLAALTDDLWGGLPVPTAQDTPRTRQANTFAPLGQPASTRPPASAAVHQHTAPPSPLAPVAAPRTYYLPIVVFAGTQAVITPERGGRLVDPKGTTTITFAPGAVPVPAVAGYSPSTPQLIPAGLTSVGTAFHLRVGRQADNAPITTLATLVTTSTVQNAAFNVRQTRYDVTPTVTIAMGYTAANAVAVDRYSLAIYRQDSATGAWVRMPTALDRVHQRVYATIEQTGHYALLGRPIQARRIASSAPQIGATQSLAPTQEISSTLRVVIDPDHGGSDPGGTVTYPPVFAAQEKTYNLQVAGLVRDRLAACGIDVIMTREGDQSVSSLMRTDIINGAEPGAAVTLAFNIVYASMGDSSTTGSGAESWENPAKPGDVALGNAITAQVSAFTGLPDRGFRDANAGVGWPIYVALHATPLYAHAELAFMDNYIDRAFMDDPAGMQAFAGAVISTIVTTLHAEDRCASNGVELPEPLSAAERARLRNLGYQNYMRYRGDPVNAETGNHLQQFTDLHVPGRGGFDLVLQRTYNSLDSRDGVFGTGWSSLLDMHLRLARDGTVDLRYPDGHGVYFVGQGDAFTPGQDGVFDRLARSGTGFVLTTPERMAFLFDAKGRLTSAHDRHDNAITFTRDDAGMVTAITDSAGRMFTVSTSGKHITAISDPIGRTIQYAYNGTNDLISVTDPRGGAHQFAYDQHLLTTMTDPAGITYLRNTYDDQGRVVEQIDASGTHSSFSYGDGQTTFTDNAGNQTIDRYDSLFRVTETQDALGASERFSYDDQYNLVSRTDKRGNVWTATYNDHGKPLTITDPQGHTVTYTYNDFNQITSVTDQGGPGDSSRTTTYTYNDTGDLITVQSPDGTAMRMTYNSHGELLTLTSPRGTTTHFAYDSQGNLIDTTDPLGKHTTHRSDGVGRLTGLTDANGHTVAFAYDANDNVVRITDPKGQATRFTYDSNNNLVQQTDRRGGVTTYTYDENLKLTSETDPEGHTTRYTYDVMYNRASMTDPRGNTTTYHYDALYRLTEVVDAMGGTITIAYDPDGNITHITDPLGRITTLDYDSLSRKIKQTDALSGTSTWTYDAVGRVTTQTNPRGAATSYVYDLRDRLVTLRDALSGTWRLAYDANGNITGMTDANGHRSTRGYDAADRLIAQTDAEGHTTQFTRDPVGNVTVITDALGRQTRATYDANDNLATLTDALGGVTALAYDAEDTRTELTDANSHTTHFGYDRDGLLVKLTEAGGQVSTFAYDPAHNLVAFTNAKGNTWRSEYDALNRKVMITDPLGHVTRYDYDAVGNLVRTTDANGIATRDDYDALNRLIGVVQNERPGVAADVQTNVTTRYTYDPVGNLIGITDANGALTTFSYDLLDRQTGEVNPLGNARVYRYDSAGNLIARTDENGATTTYTYDSDNLPVHTNYPDGTGIAYAYDAAHNQTAMTDTLGLVRNEYDALNRLSASTDHVGRRVGYAYDPVGNQVGMTYPDGRTVRYAYDPTNFAVQIIDPDGNTFDVTRDPTHNVVRVRNPNQTTVERDIDAAERLTAVRNLTDANPHEIIANFAYTLDAVGNRTRVESVLRLIKPDPEHLTTDYSYDPLYRLIRSADSAGHATTYGFDAVGNRVRQTTNDDPALVQKVDTVTTTYAYNTANQLVDSVRAVEPRGNADRETQTAQALRAFVHEVSAQERTHIDAATAAALIDQANTLITDLEGTRPPTVGETAQAIDTLRSAVMLAGSEGRISGSGTSTSLLAKLGHADDANARRGPELHVTLYDYDQNGNRVRRTAPDETSATTRDWIKTDYTYNFENGLVHAQTFENHGNGTWLPQDETFVQFDGYGRVFERKHDQHIGGGGAVHLTQYVYDRLDPIAEYDGPSHQYTNYYRGLGHILSQHDYKSQESPAGPLYYYHYDGLDSAVGMTNHQGQSVHNWRYSDYGTILDVNGKADDSSNFIATANNDPHNHYLYTGQEWDPNLGVAHFYARDYDPVAGSWLQQDPYRGQLNAPKSLHRYGYVGGNPITFVDRYGYIAFVPVLIGIGIVAIATAVAAKPAYAPAPDDQSNNIHELKQQYEEEHQKQKDSFINKNVIPYLDIADDSYKFADEGDIGAGARAGFNLALSISLVKGIGSLGKYGWNGIRRYFVKEGGELATGQGVRYFTSFNALKRALGPAGGGKVWHHIVEQRAVNVSRFGPEAIHNTKNVVSVSSEVNQQIANYYSRKTSFTQGKTVREWLGAKSYEEQYEFGRKILDSVLNGQPLP